MALGAKGPPSPCLNTLLHKRIRQKHGCGQKTNDRRGGKGGILRVCGLCGASSRAFFAITDASMRTTQRPMGLPHVRDCHCAPRRVPYALSLYICQHVHLSTHTSQLPSRARVHNLLPPGSHPNPLFASPHCTTALGSSTLAAAPLQSCTVSRCVAGAVREAGSRNLMDTGTGE